MAPFKPAGKQARWRTIYTILRDKPVGAIVTYAELAAALELHPDDDRHTIQLAMRRAARESETQDSRAIEPVPNTGYRIAEPQEHLRLAQDQQKRSRRALSRGHHKVTHVDLNGMEPEVRKAFDVVAQAFSMQMEIARRLDAKQANLERVVNAIRESQSRSDSEIEELKERLARLEAQRETPDASD